MLAAALCCAMTCMVFTACSSDSDDKSEDANPFVAALMDYQFTVSTDMLNTFNFTIEYYDENSTLQKEQLTQTEWKKNVRAKLPAKLGARLKAQLKSGVVTEGVRFDITYGYSYMGYAVTANDLTGIVVSGEENISEGLPGSNVNGWLKDFGDPLVSYLYTFDAKGTPAQASW